MPKGLKGFQKGNKICVGRKHSELTRLKIGLSNRGKIRTEKFKKNISEINKGNKNHLGIKQSDITKDKISKALKNHKVPLNHRLKLSLLFSGSGNPMWKGGKAKATRGYIYIWNPQHLFANKRGYVLEHRLVMEKVIDRYLTKEEVVHHINKINSDNRIENLMLFKNNIEHKKYHKLLKEVI